MGHFQFLQCHCTDYIVFVKSDCSYRSKEQVMQAWYIHPLVVRLQDLSWIITPQRRKTGLLTQIAKLHVQPTEQPYRDITDTVKGATWSRTDNYWHLWKAVVFLTSAHIIFMYDKRQCPRFQHHTPNSTKMGQTYKHFGYHTAKPS